MAEQKCEVSAFIENLEEQITPNLDKKVQKLLGQLMNRLKYVKEENHKYLLPHAKLAAKSLFVDKPNIILAEKIIESISFAVKGSHNPLFSIIRGGTPPTRVILGLGVLLYFTIPVLLIIWPRILVQKDIVGIDTNLLIMLSIAGAIGSIVSIMVRIHEFEGKNETDPAVLFFTGFFKPVVGAAFAVFVFAVIQAGLIPVKIDLNVQSYFYLSLAFISGFSERFAKDIATKTEALIGKNNANNANAADAKSRAAD